MPDFHLPILHHFEASPFSEKIRVVFGFRRIVSIQRHDAHVGEIVVHFPRMGYAILPI